MIALSKNIQITTDRLRLRAASASDVDLVWSATRFAGFNDWMVWDAPESKAELLEIALRNEASWENGTAYNFTIELIERGDGIGRITIRSEASADIWNIGYWMHPNHWGQGYATEAGRAILELGRTMLAAKKITTAHAIENNASQRVIEKLGFIRIGENPCGFRKNSVPVKEYEYAIEFPAHQQAP